ncbi:hypothetical protein G7Z17_g11902 [Cylindrodendrum hubeiense]|uniref:Uncharacterized protein n=1 Tax=Cylindrodendrum hubeiense TaxID=595255 RepID=A0A9P5GWB2_9HYPO|nr:hypothetical protein G7Z17_g11902 [Cylindrodendrum hubeiense]
MAEFEVTDTDLPSYHDSANNEVTIDKQTLGPATLYIAGRFVHSSDPEAPPLYEFSHSVGFLRDSDRTVKVERVDQIVRDHNGTPRVQTRNRHLFDLRHPTAGEFPTFEYHAESTSRRALCSLGIATFRSKSGLLARVGKTKGKGYRVHRAVRGADRRHEAREVIFTAAPSRDRAVGFEWSDGEGHLLAREVETDELMSLVVTAEMGAPLRDALVAAWVLRVWWELAKGNYQSNRWEHSECWLDPLMSEFSMETAGVTWDVLMADDSTLQQNGYSGRRTEN